VVGLFVFSCVFKPLDAIHFTPSVGGAREAMPTLKTCSALGVLLLAALLVVKQLLVLNARVLRKYPTSVRPFRGRGMPPPAAASATAPTREEQSKSSPGHTATSDIASFARALASDGLPAISTRLDGSTSDLLLTFGSWSLAPFVSNWVSSLAVLGETLMVVGALDDQLRVA
jgi:hypothetical protein